MYADPRYIRKKGVKASLNDFDFDALAEMAEKEGKQPGALASEILIAAAAEWRRRREQATQMVA